MKRRGIALVGCKKLFVLGAALILIAAQRAGAVTLNFSNLTGTEVDFSGGAFSFTSTNGYQFGITSVSGGVGDSVGLKGFINPGGPFTIGTITINGSLQSAPVTGSGILHITDSAAIDLTGSIQWVDISTVGVGGIINLTGIVNLTGITYGGVNSDLGDLAAAGAASDVVTFQFVPSQTLTQLKSTGGQTSYSGSIVSVPEPETIALITVGLAGLSLLRWRRTQVDQISQ
jgi:hypothetical protein